MTTKPCELCKTSFEAKTQRARFCSEKCKKRSQRARGINVGSVVPMRPRSKPNAKLATSREVSLDTGDVERAVAAELEQAGQLDTPTGAAALVLARKLDAQTDTGSAVASMVKELRATVDAALKSVPVADPLDELRRKRLERLAHAGSS